ncbi:MAG TPA: serine O-acetyltransferase EpsC [Dongiaceae bacterium]|nr:serine O-acetyltransferase EpsC [Dongiaceae bacterium]
MARKKNSQVPDAQGVAPSDLRSVVERLRQSREVTNKIRHRGVIRELPSRHELSIVVDDLAAALFPTHYGRSDLTDESIDYFVGATLDRALTDLREQVRRSLFLGASEALPADDGAERATEIVTRFADALPSIRALLVEDLAAAYEGDPAATSISEVLLCYPGFTAIVHYRLAHTLHYLSAPFISRLISSIAHSATGIDIHPAAAIGAGFFIDHGTGVVIGETAILGERVRLYQAVTLGARRLPVGNDGKLVKGIKRHPIIEDNVVIYAGATILGRITIGRDSVIGGNVWLTHSVPPGSVVTQAQMREVTDANQLTRPDELNGEPAAQQS